ncbi:MAG: LEA type 2 family protein [Bacteroidota bacterium]
MRFNFLFSALLLVMLSACAISEPEFNGFEGYRMKKIDGREVQLEIDADIENPNWFAFKLKKSNLEVFVDQNFLGTLHLDKKVKLKRKSSGIITIPLQAMLEEGALFSLMKYAGKDKVDVRLKGTAKVGVFIFSKKLTIDEKRQVSGKMFKNQGN